MPSRHESSARADYVPALCTHRPSLLPIEWLSEAFGLAQRGWQRPLRAGKLVKLGHLEEVKVVTRFPHQVMPAGTPFLPQCTLIEAFAATQVVGPDDSKHAGAGCKSRPPLRGAVGDTFELPGTP
jgi:hypothetical protein